jgi:murein DD-endopeptidase MepM/ murein hydrolase activator NlpD
MVADLSGHYTCADPSGAATAAGQPAQVCCLPPSTPGFFIPPFGDCRYTYGGRDYVGHEDYAVDFDRMPGTGGITGDKIVSSINGTVKYIVDYNGQVKILDNDKKFSVVYAHMQSIRKYITENQTVVVGQQIGEADNMADCHPPVCQAGVPNPGCRSCSTGAHLHYQQELNGKTIPMTFNDVPYPVSTSPSTDQPIGHPVTCAGIQ